MIIKALLHFGFSFFFISETVLIVVIVPAVGVVFNLECFDVLTGLCSNIDDLKCFDCLDYFMTSL